jgi:hypothetical protein
MIERTVYAPFLHDSVKSALINCAHEDEIALILELCFTPLQSVKRMMIDVLTDLGREDIARVEWILQQLIPHESKPTGLEKLQRLFQQPAPATNIRLRTAKKIAIQVARNLGAPWVLFYGLSTGASALSRQPKGKFS